VSWQCPSCGFDGNDDGTLRCTCGHENLVYEPPDYTKIDGGLIFVATGLIISIIVILASFSDTIALTKGGENITLLFLGTLIIIVPIALLVLLFKKKNHSLNTSSYGIWPI